MAVEAIAVDKGDTCDLQKQESADCEYRDAHNQKDQLEFVQRKQPRHWGRPTLTQSAASGLVRHPFNGGGQPEGLGGWPLWAPLVMVWRQFPDFERATAPLQRNSQRGRIQTKRWSNADRLPSSAASAACSLY